MVSTLVLKIDGTGAMSAGTVGGLYKNEYTIDTANKANGTDPITAVSLPLIAGSVAAFTLNVLGYHNGVEVSVFIGQAASATSNYDIIIDANTAIPFPALSDVYWNGSTKLDPSTLGNLVVGDIIRLYFYPRE